MYDNKTNIPWIEKYRPTHFDNIVLDPMNRQLFQNIIRERYFPNLLFYGPPGTGKTTTIMNLINEYQNMSEHNRGTKKVYAQCSGKSRENVIHLNASDERGIDIIRVQINQFVKTKNMFESGYKFVILDEVDYMTKNAQQSLKTLLQTCVNNVRFCLICNYISKIDESLQNEFICVRFNQLPKCEIHNFIMDIAKKENIYLSEDNISTIQKIYHSDIRSMINFIQLNHDICGKGNELHEEMNIITDKVWKTIFDMLSGNFMCINENNKRENGEVKNEKPRTYTNEEIIQYIHDISMKYNMDKRTLLNHYFDYTIRNIPHLITHEYLSIVENIVNIHDDIPIETVLVYLCECLRQKEQK